MNKTVAIHQPNFFPWLGYFDKILKSDVFVFFDDVQYPRTSSGTWGNRVKIIINGQENWITGPIKRRKGELMLFNEVVWNEDVRWREKLLKTIDLSYRKAPFFDIVRNFIEPLILNPAKMLSEYNINAIKKTLDFLEIQTDSLVLSSEVKHQGSSTDLLISIVKSVSGKVYLCGGGAQGYQDDTLFNEKDVSLSYQNFIHPSYKQYNSKEFIPGLSVIDALMNLGPIGTKDLLSKYE